MTRLFQLAGAVALLAMTPACVAAPRGADGQIPLKLGTAPTMNVSPMNQGLQCVRQTLDGQARTLRFSVGEVRDFTGKFSNEASEGGFRITQGGALMVISALGQMGRHVELVERMDTRIAEQEIALARNQLIQEPGQNGAILRPLTAGQYLGSDYYIVGGVTEANYNISSGGAEVRVMNIGGGVRHYAMNVAADLRLVDTRTLRVVKTVSVQKQYVGHEVKADTFSFFGNTLVDINAGKKRNEPLQLGVRATLEYGVMDLISAAFSKDTALCQQHADYGYRWGAAAQAASPTMQVISSTNPKASTLK
jgi:curli biogenesis system outer membrane secretion channel CsgG